MIKTLTIAVETSASDDEIMKRWERFFASLSPEQDAILFPRDTCVVAHGTWDGDVHGSADDAEARRFFRMSGQGRIEYKWIRLSEIDQLLKDAEETGIRVRSATEREIKEFGLTD